MEQGPLLFFDGSCGLCAASVRFIVRHEGPRRDLRFAPLAGPRAQELRDRGVLGAADSVVWYEPAGPGRGERVLVRSDAMLAAAAYLGGGWRVLGTLGRAVPSALRDAAYRLVARHRHRLGGAACVIPGPDERARFLDMA